MRHLLVRLASAAFVAGLVFGLNPASAALLPKLDGLVSQTNAVEDVGYRYHRGWRPYRYTGISPSLLRLRILLPRLLLPAVLPALLALSVVAASRSIRGSAGTPPVLDSVRKIGTRE